MQVADHIVRLASNTSSLKTAALQLRELLNSNEGSVTIQKVVLGRLLELIKKDEFSRGKNKRKRDLDDFLSDFDATNGEIDFPDVIVVPEKSELKKENIELTKKQEACVRQSLSAHHS